MDATDVSHSPIGSVGRRLFTSLPTDTTGSDPRSHHTTRGEILHDVDQVASMSSRRALFSSRSLTPHLAKFTPASPTSPDSAARDLLSDFSPFTPAPSSNLRPSPSSRLVRDSAFDPVVGGASPSRSSVTASTIALPYSPAPFSASASVPVTPARSNLASSFTSSLLPSDLAHVSPPTSLSNPTSSFNLPRTASHHHASSLIEAHTPTKKGRDEVESRMLVPDGFSRDGVHGLAPAKDLCTRYVVIAGFDELSRLKRDERKHALLSWIQSLEVGLKGCLTSRLDVDGFIILAFHDVRDAQIVVRGFETPQPFLRHAPILSGMTARCIDRNSIEKFDTAPLHHSLLSSSEGVLVVTVRSAKSTSVSDLVPIVSLYGEIRSIKSIDRDLYLFEFFDDRASENALQSLDGGELDGRTFSCSFEPTVTSTDEPPARIRRLLTFSPPPASSQASPRTSDPVGPVPVFDPFSPRANLYNEPRAGGATTSTIPAQSDVYWNGQRQAARGNGIQFVPGLLGSRPPEISTSGSFTVASRTTKVDQASQPLWPRARTDSFPDKPVIPPHSFPTLRAQWQGPDHIVDRPRQTLSKLRLPPDLGIVRDDRIPIGNVINYEKIEQGLEVRTTLMLKNVPNKLRDVEVMRFIEEVVGRSYDFFYLRTDYSTGCNVGYGFVNFTSTSALLAFCRQRLGTRWNLCNSDKLCVLSFANIQGKASLINHFKNSSVLDQDESRRPKLFVSSGPLAGTPETFPVCDDPVRKMRSALNAANVGLFPSQKPVFKVTQAFQGMNL
ncbi:hypothetical protein JCM3766R1_001202 [Sporobolomyces carnicolor]